MEDKKLIVVYSRVSSAAQSLELQRSAAKRYLESEGLTGNEDSIMYLSDHDVSATKLKMSQRPKLMELIQLVKDSKVKKVISYKRDRFARNFYEFVDLTKIFIKYKVEVVYTASNEQPFQNKLALEAFYGMLGQMEGENIQTRTNDARKQYPSSIFGYKRTKDNEQVRFVIEEDKRGLIVSLFTDFNNVKDEEQFLEFLMARRKGLNKPEKVLRILTNPFYAAHYESKNGYQALPHVEPMVSLELYLKAKSQVDEFRVSYEKKINEISNLFILNPSCGECGNEMKPRKENPLESGYFVCSTNHKRLMITVAELNDLVEQTVLDYVQSLSIQLAKKIISKRIVTENRRLQKEQEYATSKYLDTALELCTHDKKDKSSILNYLDEIRTQKDKYNELEEDLVALQILSHEIKSIDKVLSQKELNFSHQELQRLIELLIDKVLVHETHVRIDLFLSDFAKEVNPS